MNWKNDLTHVASTLSKSLGREILIGQVTIATDELAEKYTQSCELANMRLAEMEKARTECVAKAKHIESAQAESLKLREEINQLRITLMKTEDRLLSIPGWVRRFFSRVHDENRS